MGLGDWITQEISLVAYLTLSFSLKIVWSSIQNGSIIADYHCMASKLVLLKWNLLSHYTKVGL